MTAALGVWMATLSLSACGWGECDSDCRFERANVAAGNDDSAVMQAEIAAVADPLERDVLRLRLATGHPALAMELCPAMTTAMGKEKCQQVIGRPHLQGVQAQ